MINRIFNRIDVSSFKQACSFQTIDNLKFNGHNEVLTYVQENNYCSFQVSNAAAKSNEILRDINFEEFGFKSIKDITVKMLPDLFDDTTRVVLIPKKLYGLRTAIGMPKPINEQTKSYQIYLSDLMERVKIKTNNILQIIDDEKEIEFYAKKNIQIALIMFNSSRRKLNEMQDSENMSLVFNFVSVNLHLIHLILYLQDTFSSFYKNDIYSSQDLMGKLCGSVNNSFINQLFKSSKPNIEDGVVFSNSIAKRLMKFNCQINTLVTYYYDMMHTELSNGKPMLEADDESIVTYLVENFVDRNERRLNPVTIRTILKDYREEKRAKGNKRIKLPTCL